jgi:sialic acid synthase SpsE
MAKTLMIAEFGSNPANYDWNFDLFCRAARGADASIAKVQIWSADVIYPAHMREDRRRLEFPRARYGEFVRTCHAHGLVPMASVFDADAVEMVAQHGGLFKLAASRWQERGLIEHTFEAARRKTRGVPVLRTVPDLAADTFWRELPRPPHVPLLTITDYPCGVVPALWAVVRSAWAFKRAGVKVWGWSSHTAAPGWIDGALAARLGARYVEKHFCLSHTDDEGAHSLTPSEFANLVTRVRAWEA